MKLDKDVKMTGSEAVHIVGKASELFLTELLDRAVQSAHSAGRTEVKYQDLVASAKEGANLAFLVDLVPDIADI